MSGNIGGTALGEADIHNICRVRVHELEDRIRCALRELGVPGEHYPAPVAQAVAILEHAFPPEISA